MNGEASNASKAPITVEAPAEVKTTNMFDLLSQVRNNYSKFDWKISLIQKPHFNPKFRTSRQSHTSTIVYSSRYNLGPDRLFFIVFLVSETTSRDFT